MLRQEFLNRLSATAHAIGWPARHRPGRALRIGGVWPNDLMGIVRTQMQIDFESIGLGR